METKRRLSTGRIPSGPASDPADTGNKDAYRNLLKKLAEDEQRFTLSVHSVATPKKQQARDEKDVETIGYLCDGIMEDEHIDKWVQSTPIAWVCRKGKKPDPNTPNQDSFSILHVDKIFALYGVYDGHGPHGHDISEFVRERLVQLILEDRNSCADEGWDAVKAFNSSYAECQEDIRKHATLADWATSSGTTVTLAYHDLATNVITISWVGDSRAVLGSADGKLLSETLDHKPDHPKEKERIERLGGRVVFDGYYNHRVFAKQGMYPGLNMSRSLGDTKGHDDAGLTPEPEISSKKLEDKPQMLLLCTDGVWEFIESNQALNRIVDSIKDEKEDKVARSLKHLADESYDQWMKDSNDEISDDITGILVII